METLRRLRIVWLGSIVVVIAVLGALVAVFSMRNQALEEKVNAYEARQERAAILAAGELGFVPWGETLSDSAILATVTRIAKLNDWHSQNPVIDETYKAQYGVEMVQVPAGCFWRGSLAGGYGSEQPVHEVCFEAPFWIDRYEVTNAQFDRLEGEAKHEISFRNPDQPRTNITWDEAQAYCESRAARLPTEAEWEYAARGPDSLVYPWGNELIGDNVVYTGNSRVAKIVGEDQRPGGKSWVGAYDLSGNAYEWVADWYNHNYYTRFADRVAVNPQGPDEGIGERVLRGGSFNYSDDDLRAADRYYLKPENWYYAGGFRCARSDTP